MTSVWIVFGDDFICKRDVLFVASSEENARKWIVDNDNAILVDEVVKFDVELTYPFTKKLKGPF